MACFQILAITNNNTYLFGQICECFPRSGIIRLKEYLNLRFSHIQLNRLYQCLHIYMRAFFPTQHGLSSIERKKKTLPAFCYNFHSYLSVRLNEHLLYLLLNSLSIFLLSFNYWITIIALFFFLVSCLSFKSFFFKLSVVDIQYSISFKCTTVTWWLPTLRHAHRSKCRYHVSAPLIFHQIIHYTEAFAAFVGKIYPETLLGLWWRLYGLYRIIWRGLTLLLF